MTLRFYNCSDDYRRVKKTIGAAVWESTVMNPTTPVDLITPEFIIANDPAMPLTYNYAYCPDVKRYYFVTGQETSAGNKRAIQCLVDVRMSFVNSQIPVTVIKNEFINSNIIDNEFPVDPQLHDFKVLPLNDSVFNGEYRVIRTANNANLV